MADQGVLMTTVVSGTNLAEKAMAVPLGTVRVVRDEIFRAAFAGVDWVEGINQSMFKVVREALKRVDVVSQGAVDGLDSIAASIQSGIRGSADAAGEMVSKASSALTRVEKRSEGTKVAAA